MTEYLDILLPALAVTAFVGNAIHVMYFMDHNPEVSKRTIEDSEGGTIETQPDGPLGASAAIKPLTEVTPVPGTHVPRDSVLRRHYPTHLCSQLNELYPRPGESVLRRHHGQLIASQLEACLLEQAAAEKLQAAHEILKKQVSEEVSKPLGTGIAPSTAPDVLDGEPPAVEPETVAQAASVSSLKVRAAEPESEIPPMGIHVPEDHVLRRHYLTHILGMLQELNPAPADSVLRRHHQQHFKNLFARYLEDGAASEQLKLEWVATRKGPAEMPIRLESARVQPIDGIQEKAELRAAADDTLVFGPHVPQDHVLRRHYLALLESRLNEITPSPTDSVLRRHHQQWLKARLSRCIEDASSAAAFQADYEQWVRELGKTACKSNLLAEEGNSITLATRPLTREPLSARKAFKLPEDSVLKRHCMQYLTAEIEKFMPRPRDSVLSRHYDQWLASQIEVLL
jgi:hypothetical protein